MIHSSFSSEGHLLPKRAVFDFTGPSRNNDKTGSAERQIKSVAETLTSLGIKVTEDQTRISLEDLRGGVELQQTAQQQEEREVNALVLKSSVENGLDNPAEREQFMSGVQQRLAVTLALLVNDQEITLESLQSGSIDATIQGLVDNKETIKIGDRNLYNHEKALMGLPATLARHKNDEVKAAWETMKGNLRVHVQLMRSAAKIITETEAEEGSFAFPEWAQKLLEDGKKQWEEASPATKGIAIAAGAIGSLWLLNRMFRGVTKGGGSTLWSTLGIGALLAGGLYIAGKYMSFNEALDKLKDQFKGLDLAKIQQGLTAYVSGNLEVARRYWGESYDAMVRYLNGGTESIPNQPRTLTEDINTDQNRARLRYDLTRDTLIGFYCLSQREYPEGKRAEIREVFSHLRGQEMQSIIRLWEANKDKDPKVISAQNGIIPLPNNIHGENIFTALSIIGRTYEAYKNRFNIDPEQPLTLEGFLNRVSSDPIHETGKKIHESMLQIISEGSISFNQFNFSSVISYFDEQKETHTNTLCEKLGINLRLTQAEKMDFYAIAFSLYRDVKLNRTVDEALEIAIGSETRAPNAILAARDFFEKTKKRTQQKILPAVISKFNIENPSEPENANIMKKYFEGEEITFGQAFQLNVVTINSSFEVSSPGSEIEELTLLFVALRCLPEQERYRYYSEMARMYLNAPADFQIPLPSLVRLKPYFGKLKDLGIEQLSNKRDALRELLSAFVADRPAEEQEEYLRQVRNSDWLEFGSIAGQEGVRGGYMVAKDIAMTMVELGVTYEDFRSVEGVGDFVSLALHLGGALILPGETNGQGTGMIYLAGKYYFIKPLGIAWDTLVAGINGQEGDTTIGGRFEASFKTYVVGTAPYVVIGATGGLLTGGGAMGIATGAARGLLAPVTYPTRGIQFGMSAVEMGRQWATRGSLSNLLRNAEMMAQYQHEIPRVLQGGEWVSRTGLNEVQRRVFFGNWNESRLETFLKNFERSYNRFFNFSSAEEAGALMFRQGERATFALEVAQRAQRLRDFTSALSAHPGYAGATNPEALKSLIQQIGILEPFETTKIVGQINNASDVSRIRGMVDGGADFLRNQSLLSRGRAAFSSVIEKVRSWRGADLANAAETANDLRLNRASDIADTLTNLQYGREVSEDALNALRRSENLDELTDMLRRIGAGDGAGELIEAIKMGKSPAEVKALLTSLDQPAGTLATRLDILEATDLLKAGKDLRLDQIEMLREVAHADDITEILTRSGVQADEAARLVSGLQAGDGARALETALDIVRNRPALGAAIDVISSGGHLNLEHIGALREVAAGSDIADVLRSTGKIPEEKIGKLVQVLAQESELTKITEGLRTAGVGVAEGVEGLTRMAKFMRALPVAGAVLSAGFSIFESWQAFAMAREVQNNPGLRSLLNDKGLATAGMGVASITLDVGLLAAPSAFTAFNGVLGATGVGLILVVGIEAIKYMVTQALDARAETYKGYDAWTSEAMSRAQVEAGINLPTRTFEQACAGVRDCRATGRVLFHEELIAINAEAINDPKDAIQGLIENGGMNQVMSNDLVRGLIALSAVGLEDPADTIETLIDDAGMDESAARALVESARNGNLTTDLVLRAAGLKLTSEPRMTDAQITKIHAEAKNILLHEWLVTGNDGRSVGQTYDSAANAVASTVTRPLEWLGFNRIGHEGTEYYIQNASLTRAKLVQALVMMDSPGKSEDYLRYRIKYLESRLTDLNVESLQQARELLTKSKLAADILSNRQQTLMIGGQAVDLSNRDYDPAMITPERVKAVFDAFESQQKTEMAALLGQGIFDRIKNLDPNYLRYAAGVIMAHVTANGEMVGSDPQLAKLVNIASHIGLYLQAKGMQFSPEQVEVSSEELELIVRMFTNAELNQDQIFESLGPYQQTNRDTAAIYSLARYFGYTGAPNMAMLKNFFSEQEGKASRQGLYWDPSDNEWVVNEEYGVDNDVVQNEGESLVDAIIRTMRLKPNNVLATRYNSAMDGLRAGIRDDEARLQGTVDEMISALQVGIGSVRNQDVVEENGNNVSQSETTAFARTFVEEAGNEVSNRYRRAEGATRAVVENPLKTTRMVVEEANKQTVDALDEATDGGYSNAINWVRGSIGGLFSKK